MKKTSPIRRAYLYPMVCLGMASSLQTSQAAVQVVDPVNGNTVLTVHGGRAISFGLESIQIGGSSPPIDHALSSSLLGSAVFGAVGRLTYFSQGDSLAVTPGYVPPIYLVDDNWIFGASAGINYVRIDIDDDETYETVLELDFGTSPLFSDDVITRYAFDDGGAALDIPAAVLAMNSVPEPGTGLLGLLGGVLVLRRKRS